MRAVLCVFLLSVSCGCASHIPGEKLGGDFTLGTQPVTEADSATAAVHQHLYFKGSDLGQVGYVSVSPSGDYAIFERNSDLFLIESSSGHLQPVTDGPFALPENVRWFEEKGYAELVYSGDRPSSRISLR